MKANVIKLKFYIINFHSFYFNLFQFILASKSSSNNKSSTDETKSSRATVINKRSKRAFNSPELESSKEGKQIK